MIQQIVAAPFCKLTVRCGKPTTHVEYLPIKWIKNQLLEQGSSAPPESLQAIPGVRASSTVAQWTAAQQWHVSGRWLVSPNLPPVVFTPKIACFFFLDVKKHPFYMGHGVFECFRLMSKGHLSHLALRLALQWQHELCHWQRLHLWIGWARLYGPSKFAAVQCSWEAS